MKVLITGAGGQLAWELQRSVPAGYQCAFVARDELDITDAEAIKKSINQWQPQVVINTAAYTAVDKAETNAERAMAVNGEGVAKLARACAASGVYLLHISTDFVFDGRANNPYEPTATTNPLSVYGATKLAGEQALADKMPANWCILRTSWLYSAHGSNFVKTMLRLMQERPALSVVCDQIGTPTWAGGLAQVCWQTVANKLEGIFHWSDAGVASWYDFAIAIQTVALAKGLLREAIPIHPIRTVDYPTPALRPVFSVLDKTQLLTAVPSLHLEHWQLQLARMLNELN